MVVKSILNWLNISWTISQIVCAQLLLVISFVDSLVVHLFEMVWKIIYIWSWFNHAHLIYVTKICPMLHCKLNHPYKWLAIMIVHWNLWKMVTWHQKWLLVMQLIYEWKGKLQGKKNALLWSSSLWQTIIVIIMIKVSSRMKALIVQANKEIYKSFLVFPHNFNEYHVTYSCTLWKKHQFVQYVKHGDITQVYAHVNHENLI
jgi:hypothetical protein